MKYDFTLHYRGTLLSRGNPRHKHDLRKHFHKQLRNLVDQTYVGLQLQAAVDQLLVQRAGFRFIPLISDQIYMAGEIELFLLTPGPVGSIVTQGGDIDNRLKTLFDSLKVPEDSAIPGGATPDADEDPFYCAFADDNLITGLSVRTAQLLENTSNTSEVDLYITITGKETESFSITTR